MSSDRIFVCHLQHTAPRGTGWYWWVEGADDFMTGPFNTEVECHLDIFHTIQDSKE